MRCVLKGILININEKIIANSRELIEKSGMKKKHGWNYSERERESELGSNGEEGEGKVKEWNFGDVTEKEKRGRLYWGILEVTKEETQE